MKKVRLGVNIDHVATLRQARQAILPDPVAAAGLAEKAGAAGITVHLRSDRRHIQDRDLLRLSKTVKTHLNIEMAATGPMMATALKIKPDAVCLVPENPDEITTEGGLDLIKAKSRVAVAVKTLNQAGIKSTLFIEPDEVQIRTAEKLGARAVELNTNAYALAWKAVPGNSRRVAFQLDRLAKAARLAEGLGLEVHAGHGLNYLNVRPVTKIPQITELNIGHSIIAEAVLVGLTKAVRGMVKLLKR
ncbi:pyridoxine 5'-phosphate synthase [candidate division TA06 bacterium]|uniref:Pyridoxine 5'-phosphate synthase n=1 Tax=candidate division TA06 bacterium TaxID=2250710 RepID=A0A933IAR6_UNCT6|nr:pyridoxine 5'-phosphate synthase [candidate division TA06 bacterium]